MLNDLIGLHYRWGGKPGDGTGTIDCFVLWAEVRRRFGFYDYSQDFDWAHEAYNEESLPPWFIPRWFLRNGKRIAAPEPFSIALFPAKHGSAVGTVLDDGRVVFISEENGVVIAPMPPSIGHYFRLNK